MNGQDRAVLPESPKVDLTADVVATLSFRGLDAAPDALSRVFVLPDGGFGVTSKVFSGSVYLFGPEGDYEGSLGRAGSGPGEFGGALLATSNDRTIWVADGTKQRVMTFDSTHRIVADRLLEGLVVSLSPSPWTGGVIASGRFEDTGFVASSVWIARDGGVERYGPPALDPGPENARARIVLSIEADDKELWSFAMMGGGIQIHDLESLSLLEHRALPEAFQEMAPPGRLEIDRRPPPPQVGGILSDRGVLWAFVLVADSRWEIGLTPADGAGRIYDTMVLEIDARDRVVTGAMRLDRLCHPIRESLFSCVDEANELIRIHRIHSHRRPGPSR